MPEKCKYSEGKQRKVVFCRGNKKTFFCYEFLQLWNGNESQTGIYHGNVSDEVVRV
jgi:hypothetical protein